MEPQSNPGPNPRPYQSNQNSHPQCQHRINAKTTPTPAPVPEETWTRTASVPQLVAFRDSCLQFVQQCLFVVCFYSLLLCCETGSHYASQAGFELPVLWLLWCPLSARMTVVCYHSRLAICNLQCASTNRPLAPPPLVRELVDRTNPWEAADIRKPWPRHRSL